ncbi:uncharacterized protein [Neodiprion pinetum]|uniref:uncharacterized protein n=1 Tax=Neodiprion pinetum TaxID=441929 RepID=UPI003715510A
MLLSRRKRVEAAGELSDNQYGFRRGRSTMNAIEVAARIAVEANAKPARFTKPCAMVLLDVRNAFNTARWDKIIEALEDRKSFSTYLLRMGSVLGPFLCNVMYDGLLRMELPVGVNTIGFADDIVSRRRGAKQRKRLLWASVVHSVLLYGAPVWGKALTVAKYRLCAVRVTCAYRTVSTGAVLVLVWIPPIDLLAEERMRLAERRRIPSPEEDQRGSRATMKSKERKKTLEAWQEQWARDRNGRWTHEAIRDVVPWHERAFGEVDHQMTQALTGHGCFGSYLHRIGRETTPASLHCEVKVDDAPHTLLVYPAWRAARTTMESTTGEVTSGADVNRALLRGPEQWKAVQSFMRQEDRGPGEGPGHQGRQRCCDDDVLGDPRTSEPATAATTTGTTMVTGKVAAAATTRPRDQMT